MWKFQDKKAQLEPDLFEGIDFFQTTFQCESFKEAVEIRTRDLFDLEECKSSCHFLAKHGFVQDLAENLLHILKQGDPGNRKFVYLVLGRLSHRYGQQELALAHYERVLYCYISRETVKKVTGKIAILEEGLNALDDLIKFAGKIASKLTTDTRFILSHLEEVASFLEPIDWTMSASIYAIMWQICVVRLGEGDSDSNNCQMALLTFTASLFRNQWSMGSVFELLMREMESLRDHSSSLIPVLYLCCQKNICRLWTLAKSQTLKQCKFKSSLEAFLASMAEKLVLMQMKPMMSSESNPNNDIMFQDLVVILRLYNSDNLTEKKSILRLFSLNQVSFWKQVWLKCFGKHQ